MITYVVVLQDSLITETIKMKYNKWVLCVEMSWATLDKNTMIQNQSDYVIFWSTQIEHVYSHMQTHMFYILAAIRKFTICTWNKLSRFPSRKVYQLTIWIKMIYLKLFEGGNFFLSLKSHIIRLTMVYDYICFTKKILAILEKKTLPCRASLHVPVEFYVVFSGCTKNDCQNVIIL